MMTRDFTYSGVDSTLHQQLMNHHQLLRQQRLSAVIQKRDPSLATVFNLDGLMVDLSRHWFNEGSMSLFADWLSQRDFDAQRQAMFDGTTVNASEGRPACHPLLRAASLADYPVGMEDDLWADVVQWRASVAALVDDWSKAADSELDIIWVGIGGSDLGPRWLADVFGDQNPNIRWHFLSNTDTRAIERVQRQVNPKRCRLVIASKSMTTAETTFVGKDLFEWLVSTLDRKTAARHTAVITAYPERLSEHDLAARHTLVLPAWAGGRYSISLLAGVVLGLCLGADAYDEFLAGGAGVDQHFYTQPLADNVPLLLGVLDAGYRLYDDISQLVLLPYGEDFCGWVPYVQQLMMESLGKDRLQDGSPCGWPTGMAVWGGVGSNAQHAFCQYLHQGQDRFVADVTVVEAKSDDAGAAILMRQAHAQVQALCEGHDNTQNPYASLVGNHPSSVFTLPDMTPHAMGQLVALYEHRTLVQSVLFGVNPYDQWGVEYAKGLCRE